MLKLSQGEYVALDKVQNAYSGSPLVAQLYVHGDSLQSYLVAVIILEPTQLALIAAKVTGETVTPEDNGKLQKLATDGRVVQSVLSILSEEGAKNSLRGFAHCFSSLRVRYSLPIFIDSRRSRGYMFH